MADVAVVAADGGPVASDAVAQAQAFQEARADVVLRACGMVVASALAAADLGGVRGRVFRGWVDPVKLQSVLDPPPGGPAPQFRVGLWMRPESRPVVATAMPTRRWRVDDPMPLEVASSGDVLTFFGAAPVGTAVLFASGRNAASYTVTAPDAADRTLATLAADVAAFLPQVGATGVASGASVACSRPVAARIIRTGSKRREAQRVERRLQVSVYSPRPDGGSDDDARGLRSLISAAITENLGTLIAPKVYLPDGTSAWVKYAGQYPTDGSQVNYDVYEEHILYSCEYGLVNVTRMAAVGAVVTTLAPPSGAPFATIPTATQPEAPYGAGEQT